MKEFFLDLLYSLDKLAGIRQIDKLLALPEEDSKREIKELLEVLCRTSDAFPLIPKKDQQGIIKQSIISDGDFIGLNAKFVYKSLAAHRDRYFKEAAHIPSEPTHNKPPLEGEARQKALNEWLKSLQGFEERTTQSHVQELVSKLPAKEKGTYHPSTPPEVANQIQERIRKSQEKVLRDKYPTASEEDIIKLLEKL
jgi:hypothetical protein